MCQFAARSSPPTQYDTYPFIDPSRFAGKLKGKVVIITGASSGVGKTSAHAFAAAGASVACVARRQAELEAIVQELKAAREINAIAVTADVCDPPSARHIIETVESELGPPDVILNCAGITRFGTLAAETDFETWWRVVNVNLRGLAALIHAGLPSMIRRGSGVVMSVTSTSGSQNIPYNTAYATSKAAVIKLHQDLAVELRRHGIVSFSVHPGTIATDLSKSPEAINMASVNEEPDMQQALQAFGDLKYQTPQLPADTFVALFADERCKALSGKYIDAEQDLGTVLDEIEKQDGGRVEKDRLYQLKVDEL